MNDKTHYDELGRLVLSVEATGQFREMMLRRGGGTFVLPGDRLDIVRALADYIYEESGIDFEVYT